MPFETVVLKTIEYLSIPSVVGHERFFIEYLSDDFQKLGLNTHINDGILEVSAKNPNKQIVCAHLDRHGLISVGDNKYRYAARHIKEKKYNEENPTSKAMLNAISSRFEDEIVFAYHPYDGKKLAEGKISQCEESAKNHKAIFLLNDVEEDMPIDTPIAYARKAENSDGFLKGQIDNVISLGIIYALFQNGFQGTALLSTEEEIGKSWIHITNWLKHNNKDTKELLVIDTSPYRESDPVDNNMVVLRNRDKSAEFNAELTQKIKDRCEKLSIPYQVKDEFFLSLGLSIPDLGSTELGRIVQNSDGLWSGSTIQIPTLEYHTSYETTSRGCIDNYYALLQNILITDPMM